MGLELLLFLKFCFVLFLLLDALRFILAEARRLFFFRAYTYGKKPILGELAMEGLIRSLKHQLQPEVMEQDS